MKKILIAIISLLIIAFVVGMFMLRGSSGFRSIYFVPSDAIAIVEIQDPIKTWDKIVHSKVWNHYRNNSYFKELNSDIQSYDSLLSSNTMLFKMIGAKSVLMSVHEISKEKYDYIYIIDIGKVGRTKNPEKLLNSVLGGSYKVTSRKHNNTKIVEILDIDESEYYFVSFAEGNLMFSVNPKLLEKALDASIDKQIGLDSKFLNVQSKISNKGLLSVFCNYNNITNTIGSLSDNYAKTFSEYTKYLSYTGLYFDIDENGLIAIEGFTSFKDETPTDYYKILPKGKTEIISAKVIPQRIASLTKVSFYDSEAYFQQLMKNMGENVFAEYENNLKLIEKKLKINASENLFQWIDEEIVFLHTQPSNLGRSNELAIILNANDSADAANNLNFLWKQIKKNTPVKVKSIKYMGYNIDYVAFPGIIQAFFGKTIDKLEKPYFTQIGNSVIISNHPQTIKNIINDYSNENTLAASVEHYNFTKLFSSNSSLYFYFEPPVFFQNMKGFVDSETWFKLKQQKKYITCFKQGAVNINNEDELLHLNFKIQYEPNNVEFSKQNYNASDLFLLFSQVQDTVEVQEKDSLPQIIISDLDSKKHEEYYEDGALKLEVKLKDGMKNGSLKMYHANGKLSLKGEYENDKPTGKWKYYNENGDLVKTDNYK